MRRIRIFRTGSFRLAALFAGLFAGAAAILIATVYLTAENALRSELLATIDGDIGAVTNGYRTLGLGEAVEVIGQRTAIAGFSDFYLLQDKAGKKIAGNLPAMAPRLGLVTLPPPASTFRNPREHQILGRGEYLGDAVYLFAGQDTHQMVEAREGILRAFAGIVGVTLLIAIGGGIMFGLGFLKRVDAITQTCRAIVAGHFTNRVPVKGSHDEFDLVAVAINDMLNRIGALMESLRQVSSDIAHDLRTPLTHLRQRLDHARARAETVDDYRDAVGSAIEDADEILTVFSALLRISQIEAGTRTASFREFDLSVLLLQIAELYAAVAEDYGQSLEADIAPGIAVVGDRALLMQMFSNLVENALRHTQKGTKIRIELTREGAQAVVKVRDGGAGIPQAERERVFDRFYRLESSRTTPGNGLGLALVAAIAGMHHIAIELSDNQPGLCVRLAMALTAPAASAFEHQA